MIGLDILLEQVFRVEHSIVGHEKYLAHLLKHTNVEAKDETLAEHLDLVLAYCQKIITAHGIEIVIEQLIQQLVSQNDIVDKVFAANEIKKMFLQAVAFHDHGKINENFQVLKMKNTLFQEKKDSILFPTSGHSALSAFIFLTAQINNICKNQKECNLLIGVALVLADPIFLHHAPRMKKTPKERIESHILFKELDFINNYLKVFGLEEPMPITKSVLSGQDFLNRIFGTLSNSQNNHFALLALVRLNFSLLTASDFLATSEYMSGEASMKPIKDANFGVIDNELRKRIIENSQNSKIYNQKTFEKANILGGGDR